MFIRILGPSAVVALVILATVGCAATPEPAAPAPLFTSEAEAFAAAEETYRAYVDAVNARRLDGQSSVDPNEFLSSGALEAEIDAQRALDTAGLTIVGRTTIPFVAAIGHSESLDRIEIAVCLDSSQTSVTDRDGQDVTPSNRAVQVLVSASLASTGKRLVIEASDTLDSERC